MNGVLLHLLIPLHLGFWLPIPVGSGELPKITEQEDTWQLSSRGTAGSYIYLFTDDKHLSGEATKLSWEWKVTTFPKARPKPPFDKANDDYALRVGLLFSLKGHRMRLPAAAEKSFEAKGTTVSYVLLYGAVPDGSPGCGKSPYGDEIFYCTRAAPPELTKITTQPVQELARLAGLSAAEKQALGIVGIWLSADSDNSKSESLAAVRNVILEVPPASEEAKGLREMSKVPSAD